MKNRREPGCNSANNNPVKCNNKKHYRSQALIFHSDKNRNCVKEANEKWLLLDELCPNKMS